MRGGASIRIDRSKALISARLAPPLISLPGSSPRKDGEKCAFAEPFANRHRSEAMR